MTPSLHPTSSRFWLGMLLFAAFLGGWSAPQARAGCDSHVIAIGAGLGDDVTALADFRQAQPFAPGSGSIPGKPCSGPFCDQAPTIPMPSAPATSPLGDRMLEAWDSSNADSSSRLSGSLLPPEAAALHPHHQGRRLERPPRAS